MRRTNVFASLFPFPLPFPVPVLLILGRLDDVIVLLLVVARRNHRPLDGRTESHYRRKTSSRQRETEREREREREREHQVRSSGTKGPRRRRVLGSASSSQKRVVASGNTLDASCHRCRREIERNLAHTETRTGTDTRVSMSVTSWEEPPSGARVYTRVT